VGSHIDNFGLDHRVLDSCRAPGNSDVPDGDVVVATWWETAEWVDKLNRNKGAKAYFIQGFEVFPNMPVERVRSTYRLPFHQIVVARWLKDTMEREFGSVEVDEVPNSVDKNLFFAVERDRKAVPTVGFLYHEAPLKGLEIALNVLAKLKSLIPELKAVCFGSRRTEGKYHLDDWVDYHAAPPQHVLRDLYASCDVWLATSRSEGFNLTAMEAMACRTPVVSTRTGWPMEAISSGRNGVLVDIDDVDGLVASLQWIFGLTNDQWKVLSSGAYDAVRDSTWNASSKLFERALTHASERALRGEVAGGRFAGNQLNGAKNPSVD
jgi:glycosyltransferase involved in cell wall biosynthesis